MANGGNGNGGVKAERAAQLHFDQVERAAAALRRGIAERTGQTPPRPMSADSHKVERSWLGLTPDEMIVEQQAIAEAARVWAERSRSEVERIAEMNALGQEWLQ